MSELSLAGAARSLNGTSRRGGGSENSERAQTSNDKITRTRMRAYRPQDRVSQASKANIATSITQFHGNRDAETKKRKRSSAEEKAAATSQSGACATQFHWGADSGHMQRAPRRNRRSRSRLGPRRQRRRTTRIGLERLGRSCSDRRREISGKSRISGNIHNNINNSRIIFNQNHNNNDNNPKFVRKNNGKIGFKRETVINILYDGSSENNNINNHNSCKFSNKQKYKRLKPSLGHRNLAFGAEDRNCPSSPIEAHCSSLLGPTSPAVMAQPRNRGTRPDSQRPHQEQPGSNRHEFFEAREELRNDLVQDDSRDASVGMAYHESNLHDRDRLDGKSMMLINNNDESLVRVDQMEAIREASRFDLWHWDEKTKSDECVLSNDKLDVCFHPECSQSAAAIRGTKPFVKNGNYYYWEVTVFNKVYGTSVMFGLCTKDQRMDLYDYRNLIGLDENGWSLSHKGAIWHKNKNCQYTEAFPTDRSVTIGMLYDTQRGTLSYFKDGVNLGVAFYNLNDVEVDLFPVVGSTAKCTRMRLEGSYCGNMSLKEIASYALVKSASHNRVELLNDAITRFQLPSQLVLYLAQSALNCHNQAQIKQQRILPEEHRSMVTDDYDETRLQGNQNHHYQPDVDHRPRQQQNPFSDTNVLSRATRRSLKRGQQQQQQERDEIFMSYN